MAACRRPENRLLWVSAHSNRHLRRACCSALNVAVNNNYDEAYICLNSPGGYVGGSEDFKSGTLHF